MLVVSEKVPLPVIADTFRCTLSWTGQPWSANAVNVIHVHAPSSDEGDVFTSLDGAASADMWAHTSIDVGVSEVTIVKLDGSSAGVVFPTGFATQWRGTGSSGNAIVPQVAAIVKAGTAKRGRSYRGRVYLPWPMEVAINAGQLNSVDQGLMNTAWSGFLSAMVGDLRPMTIASYKLATQEQVTSLQLETFLGTIRRRQPRA
jgi:hypothetical protein